MRVPSMYSNIFIEKDKEALYEVDCNISPFYDNDESISGAVISFKKLNTVVKDYV